MEKYWGKQPRGEEKKKRKKAKLPKLPRTNISGSFSSTEELCIYKQCWFGSRRGRKRRKEKEKAEITRHLAA